MDLFSLLVLKSIVWKPSRQTVCLFLLIGRQTKKSKKIKKIIVTRYLLLFIDDPYDSCTSPIYLQKKISIGALIKTWSNRTRSNFIIFLETVNRLPRSVLINNKTCMLIQPTEFCSRFDKVAVVVSYVWINWMFSDRIRIIFVLAISFVPTKIGNARYETKGWYELGLLQLWK